MRLARILLVAHVGALLFGLAGLLIALPNPQLWQGDPNAVRVFDFGMGYAGSLHIVLGAAAMFAFGVASLGWRRTVLFFAFATTLSLHAELIGTGTGWPFGNYAYTDFLGLKVLGYVPFSIPLSWFYVGFACYLLGSTLAARFAPRHRTAWGLALGVWFLTVWDLVLDPAMAHEQLPVKFWNWSETGPYLGMPFQNFVGWSLTGLLFMGLARLAWNADLDPARDRYSVGFPFAIYAANTFFAMALSASVGLWLPIALSAVLGLLPAGLAWWWSGGKRRSAPVAGGRAWRPLPSR